MSKSNEKMIANDLFYVFVTLKSEYDRPDFYVLPSKLVAKYIKKTHERWTTLPPKRRTKNLEQEEKRKSKRMKSTLRQFPNYVGKMITDFKDFNINDYKDTWEILER